MSDPSKAESFDPFRASVRRLIDFENGKGKAHFSFEAQGIQSTAAVPDLSELDDIDQALLELLTTSLEETTTLLDTKPEELTDEFRKNILLKFNVLSMIPAVAPTQKLFRAYMNNRFAVLVGQIQFYTSVQKENDTEMLGDAVQDLRETARAYLPILKGGR